MDVVRGPNIEKFVDRLGAFRISIFREYPYLYDGDIFYERDYLSRYVKSPASILCVIEDERGICAACTGIPLKDEDASSKSVFSRRDIEQTFYVGEVMVRADSRKRGLGRRLLSEMIGLAAEAGYQKIALFVVDRGEEHPARPEHYWAPEALWRKFGFELDPKKRVLFMWKDMGSAVETAKPMSVWIREG